MPVVFDQIQSLNSKLSESLKEGFKKNEKENYENFAAPTIKQVLAANIEYEEAPNHANTTLNSLQTKYIVLKPNQPPLQPATNATTFSYAKVLKANDGNERSNGTSTTSNSSSSSSLQLPKPKRELFDKSKIKIGWNMQTNVGSGQGFNNIGNTCYLNSALQAFFHVPTIAQWLLSDREHRDKCMKDSHSTCLICCMAHTLNYSHRNSNSFTPSYITNRLHSICKHLTIGRQEDAHEFLRYLIDKMERAYLLRFKNEPWYKDLDQYSKETTPLNQLLGGYLRSTVTCLSCHHESVTFQHFQDLPLDISKVNKLGEAIEGYFSRENLEECGYKCESCKRRVSAAKKFSLERAPVVLCIQLKRFSAMGGKISKPISITEKLSLQKYLSKSGDTNQHCNYRFVSMVTHLGSSASGGHYTAVGLSPNGNFYSFDDCRVSPVSLDQALRVNGYILFYELDKSTLKVENGHSRFSNGHSIEFQNEHTYSKPLANGLSSSFSAPSRSNSSEQSFSRPSLPKIIPHTVMKQQQKLQKENNESTPSKNGVKSPDASENQRVAPLTIKLTNGQKRDGSEQQHPTVAKKIKFEPQHNGTIQQQQPPSFPSMPKINGEESSVVKNVPTVTAPPPTITSSKSLVPYDSDDDEEETASMKEARVLHTASGVFLEIDSKENSKKGPSVQGSTIVTKALNGLSIKRSDDAVQQLSKLHHNGYGTSNVVTWQDQPSQMNREVSKDQQFEDRKRPHEREDDIEMDRGRLKKIKRNSPPRNNEKLPNPFQQYQNKRNDSGYSHNGSYEQPRYFNNQYNSNGNYRNSYSQNNNNNYGHSKNFKNGGFNKNQRHFNRNRHSNYPTCRSR